MELNRKKISDSDIAAKEKEIYDSVCAAVSEYESWFSNLGYELVATESEVNDDTGLNEDTLSFDSSKYKSGYVSSVTVYVRKFPETEEEEEDDDDGIPEIDTESQDYADKTLAKSDSELKRTFAFTKIMLIRIYTVFWSERVSVTDNADVLREDLKEFYNALMNSQNDEESAESENDNGEN